MYGPVGLKDKILAAGARNSLEVSGAESIKRNKIFRGARSGGAQTTRLRLRDGKVRSQVVGINRCRLFGRVERKSSISS